MRQIVDEFILWVREEWARRNKPIVFKSPKSPNFYYSIRLWRREGEKHDRHW
jgi:hypothetical protein